MQTLKIEVTDDALNTVMMLLKNLKKGIIKDISIINDTSHKSYDSKHKFNPKEFYNVMNETKDDIDKYLLASKGEWDNYLDER